MNFFPLCTASVCPIISGTIVERRDHVFTTFFSLRAFIASTFTRRWSSTNGPFFSDRGIGLLLLHAAQLDPLRATNLAESAHGPGNAMRNRAEGTNKPRPLRVRNLFYRYGPTGPAQPKHYLGRWRELRNNFSLRLQSAASRRLPRPSRAPGRPSRRSCGCHVHLNSPPRRVHIFSSISNSLSASAPSAEENRLLHVRVCINKP